MRCDCDWECDCGRDSGGGINSAAADDEIKLALRPHYATAEMAGGLSHLDSKEGRVQSRWLHCAVGAAQGCCC
jgi:hypothetical protein